MQTSQLNTYRVPSYKSPMDFLRPYAYGDQSTQNSCAATSQRSTPSSTNRLNFLASRLSQYSTPSTDPSKPSVPLGQLSGQRKRPVDSWPASTRGSKVSRGDTHTSARSATTVVTPVDTVMAPIMRAKAKAKAELRSSDDEQPDSYDAESSAATISRERSSEISKVTAHTEVNDFKQFQAGPSRPGNQCQEDSQNSAPPNSMSPATRNEVPLSTRELGATGRIWAHYQNYEQAMGTKRSKQMNYVVIE
jgi:hypothetical protein